MLCCCCSSIGWPRQYTSRDTQYTPRIMWTAYFCCVLLWFGIGWFYPHPPGTPHCHRGNLNTLRPRQNGRHFADDICKCIFLSENLWSSLRNSLKFVPKVRINNITALVQIMAWRRSGDKPLSEPMVTSSLTHICVTRPQWVKFVSVLTVTQSRRIWVNECRESKQKIDITKTKQSNAKQCAYFCRHLLSTNQCQNGPWCPFYWHDLTAFSIWISNYIHGFIWDAITYPYSNLIKNRCC